MKIFKLLTLISITSLTSFSHNEVKFENLTNKQQEIHKKLFTKAIAAIPSPTTSKTKTHLKNYLTASILIYLSDKTTLEVPISPTPNNVFVSGFDRSVRQFHEDSKSVLDIGFDNENPKEFTTKGGKIDHRIGDTEWALIYTLCQLSLDECLTNFDRYSEITSLELHCHTTRDMCPCCYQHMQNFLDECNKIGSEFENLFKKILEIAEKPIHVSFYVSSVCGFLKDSKEFNCSNYSYCETPFVDGKGVNYIFLRKNPKFSLLPQELTSTTKFEDLFIKQN